MHYKTEQEQFWAGDFGRQYIERNASDQLLASNIALFSRVLQRANGVKSVLELGCNIGMNLRALRTIAPLQLAGCEINEQAAEQARRLGIAKITTGTITEPMDAGRHDLTFTKGVLIHINPDRLPTVYENLYRHSSRYIMVCEYYNPAPVEVPYRGHAGRLFKRDFAGEMLDHYRDLRLIDYGFAYKRDNYFPQDDLTWFLLERVTA
jgi:pseudaminic acid biosynthesis-associated methylase